MRVTLCIVVCSARVLALSIFRRDGGDVSFFQPDFEFPQSDAQQTRLRVRDLFRNWRDTLLKGSKLFSNTTGRRAHALRRATSTSDDVCHHCLCHAGVDLDYGPGEPLAFLRESCLLNVACCDCRACRKERRSGCDTACSLCDGGQPYTPLEFDAAHPQPSALDTWDAAQGRNGAIAWATATCSTSPERVHLHTTVVEELACLAASLGPGRAYYCACTEGDKPACERLGETAGRFGTLVDWSEALRGSPAGWFCGSSFEFGQMGAALFSTDLDPLFEKAVPLIMDNWASNVTHMMETTDKNVSIRLTTSERHFLMDHIVSLREQADVNQILMSQFDAERTRLLQSVSSLTAVSMSCVASYTTCSADSRCATVARALSAQTSADIGESLKLCDSKGAMVKALTLARDCLSYPQEAIDSVVGVVESIAEKDLCARAFSVGQRFAKERLPVALTSGPSGGLPACVDALHTCGSDEKCLSGVQRVWMAKSIIRSAGAILDLCDEGTVMLKVLRVSAECPGPLPSNELRAAWERLSQKDFGEGLCAQTSLALPSASVPSSSAAAGWNLETPCAMALRRCAASPGCGTVAESVSRRGAESPDEMLEDLLGVCKEKEVMLKAMDVASECGYLSQVEARESRVALAAVAQVDLCQKMGQLSGVLGVLLRPSPNLECEAAQQECAKSSCGAVQHAIHAQGGTISAALSETLGVCTDKSAFILSSMVATRCQKALGHLQPDFNAFVDVPPSMLCTKAFYSVRRMAPAVAAATLTVAVTPSPSCVEAYSACGSRERCQSMVLSGSMSFSDVSFVDSTLRLCDDRTDMLALLGVAAECSDEAELRSLRAALVDSSDVCSDALRFITMRGRHVEPWSPVCMQAQLECHEDERCSGAARKIFSHGPHASMDAVQSLLTLCDSRSSFLKALNAAGNCSGALPTNEVTALQVSLRPVRENDLCAQAADVAQGLMRRMSPPSTAVVSGAIVGTLAEDMPLFASNVSQRIMDAFDTLPRDGYLNTFEVEIFMKATTGALHGIAEKIHVASEDRLLNNRDVSAALQPWLQQYFEHFVPPK